MPAGVTSMTPGMIAAVLLCKGVLLEGIYQLKVRSKQRRARRPEASSKHPTKPAPIIEAFPNADKSVWTVK